MQAVHEPATGHPGGKPPFGYRPIYETKLNGFINDVANTAKWSSSDVCTRLCVESCHPVDQRLTTITVLNSFLASHVGLFGATSTFPPL